MPGFKPCQYLSLGLRLDDSTLGIAVGLRLGTAICAAHQCQNCSEEVDCQGSYGLSCCYSEGIHVHHKHRIVTSITYRVLPFAKTPSRLESVGLLRSNGKGPDGRAAIPWTHGQLLVWDATCPHTLAVYY